MVVYLVWEYYWSPESIDRDLYGIYANEEKAKEILKKSQPMGFLSTWYEVEERNVLE